jgi:hypothetical protein
VVAPLIPNPNTKQTCWVSLSKGRLEAEIVFLRHQLNVLRRRKSSRARLSLIDRLIFVWLYRLRPSVLNADVLELVLGQRADELPGLANRLVREGEANAEGERMAISAAMPMSLPTRAFQRAAGQRSSGWAWPRMTISIATGGMFSSLNIIALASAMMSPAVGERPLLDRLTEGRC